MIVTSIYNVYLYKVDGDGAGPTRRTHCERAAGAGPFASWDLVAFIGRSQTTSVVSPRVRIVEGITEERIEIRLGPHGFERR